MTLAPRRVAVVGASLAGLRAAEALRAEGFDGALTIVGAEPHRPYNRPPLSKELLAGTVGHDEVHLQATGEIDADWRLGVAATGLDLDAREVELADGARIPFDGLVIATGSDARPLGAGAPDGVHLLRTLDDSLRLRAALEAGERVAVVGAGFIGCEVAATAQALGCEVTMIDVAPAPMEARLGPLLGAWAARFHEARGVRLVLGVGVDGFEDDGGRLRAIRLADGTRVEADVAVVGLGSVPNTGWLAGSGVPLGDGVVCDAALAVEGVPGVVAAGDVASWPHAGVRLRVEHWSNAVEQGMWAARTLLHGGETAGDFRTLPSFWSDQHGVRIQSIGLPALGTDSVVVDGSPDEDRFVVVYARDARVVGAVCVGLPPKRLARLRGPVMRGEPLTSLNVAVS
jgi:3-phenylpropionate/trans-cinnamate dioxygenase ferredoxin reductase subunit